MDCAAFEERITAILAGEVPAGERPATLDRLRSHAAGCGECAAGDGLLEWLELPPEARDLVDAPPEDYWEDFQRRLHDRIADGPARSARRPAARVAAVAAAAAAAVLLMLGGYWALDRLPVGKTGSTSSVAARGERSAENVADPLPQPLIDLLGTASTEEDLTQLDYLLGGPQVWGAEHARGAVGPFPDTESLDSETRERLLQWLREQNADLDGATS